MLLLPLRCFLAPRKAVSWLGCLLPGAVPGTESMCRCFPWELQEIHTSPLKEAQAELRGDFEQNFVQLLS